MYTTTTTNTSTIIYSAQAVTQPAPITRVVPQDYRDWWWFNDMLKLCEWVSMTWHAASHDPIPKSSDKEAWEEVDPYFLTEMKLEAQGWKGMSIGYCSPYEITRIREWVGRRREGRKKLAWASSTHIVDGEIFPMVGYVDLATITVMCRTPEVFDDLSAYLTRFSRPLTIVINQEITPEIKALLPKNHLIAKGSDATVISYDLVPAEANQKLAALHIR